MLSVLVNQLVKAVRSGLSCVKPFVLGETAIREWGGA